MQLTDQEWSSERILDACLQEPVDASEVIAESGVHVERSRGKVMAQCPFHGGGTERTPSMSVNDEKGVYYCFACQAGGTVIDFLQEHEGMTASEAIAELAARYGVEGAEILEEEVHFFG